MSTIDDDKITGIGCLVLLLAIPTTVILDAWVIVRLWTWFVVPLGAVAITMRTAVGMDLIANLIHRPHTSMNGNVDWAAIFGRVVLLPLWALAVGAAALRWLP